ncbi:endo-1,4-beta-xylanase [Bacillus alkalicellulosilyticus]|uniref:endo-1,4-beta-xylanase n=1 Tax=Alkalihalobacterium alkalicellulosilyticum TaxID=1912214 RepID=UPI00148204A4|nr:endo-1,4-beta-xylanase [Bacillus alkalicellulosilyticus]
MKRQFKKFILVFLVALLTLPSGLITVAAETGEDNENVVYQSNFSDDNHGFQTDAGGDGSVEKVTVDGEELDAFYITNRTGGWNSPTLAYQAANVEVGKTYEVTANFYSNEAQDVTGSYQIADNEYSEFDGLSAIANEEVVTVTAVGTVDDLNGHFRFQTNGEAADELSYYLLDVKIVELLAEEPVTDEPNGDEPVADEPVDPQTIAFFDFEESAHGFRDRGDGRAQRTNEDSYEGDYSLKVTDRAADWHGTIVTLSEGIDPTATYRITGYVKINDFDGNQTFKATVDNGDYTTFAQQEITSDEWTEFTGEYQTRLGEDSIDVYFESSNVSAEYYLDSITVEMIAPAEELDNEPAITMEKITFEDTDLHESFNGFVGRGGVEELSIVEGVNRTDGGNYSLLTENRTQEWNGPMIDVYDYVDLGSEYEISVWVKMKSPETSNVQLKVQMGSGDNASYPEITNATVTADEWVNLKGTYTFRSSGGGNISVYLETPSANESFYIDDFSFVKLDSAPVGIQPDLPSIKDVYADHFLIGSAANMSDFEGVNLELLSKHFNKVTAENAMKPQYLYDADGNLNFDSQNEFVETAIQEGFQVHGHAIAWHSQSNYDRLFPEGISEEDAIKNLEDYIEAVMKNYAQYDGDLISWDVLNEVIVVDNSQPYTDWRAHLRNTRALQVLGPEYVQMVFEITKHWKEELDLDVTLFYNDYNDHIQSKAQIIYYMVKEINENYQADNNTDDLLIEGVGMQSHYNINLNPDNVALSMDRFISLGVEIGVTELDVMAGENHELTEAEANQQAWVYAKLFEIYLERSEHISRVTFWGMGDGGSWRSEQNPLIFDRRLQAKPAFYAVVDPIGFLEAYEEMEIPARQGQAIYTEQAPTINGEIDDVWNGVPVLRANRAQQAWQTAQANARALWDEEYLYLLLEVSASQLVDSNSNPWEQDSVEIFLDQKNTKQPSYTRDEGFGQYRVNFNNVFSTGEGGPYTGVETATTVNGNSYVVEMKIPLYAIEPVDGHVLGFDFQVNDAEPGSRRGVMAWNDTTGMGWSDPSVFGELKLVSDRSVEVPEREVVLGEPIVLYDQAKLVVPGTKTSILTPSDIPFGTQITVTPYTPGEEVGVDGKVLTVAGELVTVTIVYPEGQEDYEGDFVLELGVNPDATNPGVFYLGSDGWEHVGGEVDGDVIRITVAGFSTYGVFEVEQDGTDPGTGEPGTGEPGTGEPGTGEPGTGEPGTGEPGTGEPGTGEPGTGEPGTGEPGTGEPGTGEPGSGDDTTTPGKDKDKDKKVKEDKKDKKDKDGKKLPSTATNLYNYLLIGGLLLIAGIVMVARRRATN